MSFNDIGNGSSFTSTDWDSFHNHNHTNKTRNAQYLNSRAICNSEFLLGIPQQSYQQFKATTFTNQDFLAVDKFTTASGANSTYSGGTAIWTGSYYTSSTSGTNIDTTYSTINRGVWANVESAFDYNDSTSASFLRYHEDPYGAYDTTGRLGKTFSAPRYIKYVRIKVSGWVSYYYNYKTVAINLYTYNGSTWTFVAQIAYSRVGTGYSPYAQYNDYYNLDATVQGIAVEIATDTNDLTGGDTLGGNIYELSYSGFVDSTMITKPLLPLTGSEFTATTYVDANLPAGTSINIDYTDGTNTISDCVINKSTDISSLSSGSIGLTFNFTSNGSLTPKLLGYGVYINK